MRIRKPRQSFEEYVTEKNREEYLADINRLAILLHCAAKKGSELDIDVKCELVTKLCKKLNQRRAHRKVRPVWGHWDGRNHRPVEAIRKRIAAAFD